MEGVGPNGTLAMARVTHPGERVHAAPDIRTRDRGAVTMSRAAGAGTTARTGGAQKPEPAPVPVPVPIPPPVTEAEVAGGQEAVRGRWAVAVRERLPLWLQLRCGFERRGLVALVVVLVAVLAFGVHHFWTGRPQPVRPPEAVGDRADDPAASRRAPTGGAAGGVATPAGRVVVDIGGKVRRPGVRRLPQGSRVEDALRAAGGVRKGADTTGLNRARVLIDGEQVIVGAPPDAAASGASSGAQGTPGAQPGGAISLNSATPEQLETLPGVGPVLAQHIVDYRTEHGGFRSVDELREVNGIGDKRFADLRDAVGP
ncbi:ComEA family DNA-binding protein [Streptomyces triticagri]|uniref:ComEA family DNA-binding protein n=1 Tax=Streptomyces triticagri TaxID=2293568 RepID=UPI001F26D9F6|nr:ComEA family DNA-binding protein [Streptomyces triticagri]